VIEIAAVERRGERAAPIRDRLDLLECDHRGTPPWPDPDPRDGDDLRHDLQTLD